MTGPPLSISMDFIAGGLVEMIGGLASRRRARSAYAWWAPLVLAGAWLATHWLLRESAVWRDRNTDEVRGAQRDADYAYRLAVDPPAGQGTAAVRARRLDDRALRRAAHAPARSCSTKRRGCASSRCSGACCSSLGRQRRRVLVARRRGRRRTASTLGEVVVFAQARSARR